MLSSVPQPTLDPRILQSHWIGVLFKRLTNKHLDDATVNLKISSKLPIFFVAASSRRVMGSEIFYISLFGEKFI
jgi:hypothetical protein